MTKDPIQQAREALMGASLCLRLNPDPALKAETAKMCDDALVALEGVTTVSENVSKAGRVTSEAKAAAVRENGKKGGRPRKNPPTT